MEEVVLQVIKWLGIVVLTVTVGETLIIFAFIVQELSNCIYNKFRRLRNENSKAKCKAH